MRQYKMLPACTFFSPPTGLRLHTHHRILRYRSSSLPLFSRATLPPAGRGRSLLVINSSLSLGEGGTGSGETRVRIRSRFFSLRWWHHKSKRGLAAAAAGRDSATATPAFSLAEEAMTVTATPRIKGGCLRVRDRVVLADVPGNVVVTPLAGGSAAFVGAESAEGSRSRHVFSLGVLQSFRLLCLFRCKIWWMIPRWGKSGADVPPETQMLLLEVRQEAALKEVDGALVNGDDSSPEDGAAFYILVLSVLDGDFRASLQGTAANELELCVESGDPAVQTSAVFESLFIASGDNPYDLMRSSIKLLAEHKGTFSHLDDKKIPANLDWFGWCTWDAFYHKVNPKGITDGLRSLKEGGCPAKFLIIDDGWQDTVNEFCKEGEPHIEGTQFAMRLVDIKENSKFKADGTANEYADLGEFVQSIKRTYGLIRVYVWHALAGYWGGVDPTSKAMKKYNPRIEYPVQSPGNIANQRDIAMDSLEKYGVGVVDPSKIADLYNDMHRYLSSKGVDGVKVDVQNAIETLGSGHGGRVKLTRQFQVALEQSVAKNFRDNNLICCMSHNSDYIFSSKKGAVARASEDFMPHEPKFQTLHIASVSFISMLLGEVVVPDWDMFQTKHVTAEFHGAARALGGCGVYVSDKPGEHDFNILRKLVLPDGSVLRAKHAGRPTRDCLFEDPVMDGKSLLKIWNLNKFSGVIGAFNCQGAGSWPLKEDGGLHISKTTPISGKISPSNVEFLEELAGEGWTGECAVYAFNQGLLSRLPKTGTADVSLCTLQCEIYTVSPIKEYTKGLEFAPLGLLNMYNSGGAVKELSHKMDTSACSILIKGLGYGRFGAYSNQRPQRCTVDGCDIDFDYCSENGLLTVLLPPIISSQSGSRDIQIVYSL